MEAAAGLGALGFWLFIAAVVVAGIWFDAKKRESDQETLRRIVESGQQVDKDVIDQLMAAGKGSSRPDRDLKIGGLITMFVAPGLAVLGWFLGRFAEEAQIALYGVAVLVLIVGAGLYVAGKVYERWYRDDQGLEG